MDSSHAYFAEKLHDNLKGGLGTSDDAVVRVVVSHSEVSGPVLGYVWIPACDMFGQLLIICFDTCLLDCNVMRCFIIIINN